MLKRLLNMELSLMTNKVECSKCDFYEKKNSQTGECRIRPPVEQGLVTRAIFPIVESTDWCGGHSDFDGFEMVNPDRYESLIKCQSMIGKISEVAASSTLLNEIGQHTVDIISENVVTHNTDSELQEFSKVTTSGGVTIVDESEITNETSDNNLDKKSPTNPNENNSDFTGGKIPDENSDKKADENSDKILDEKSQINLDEKSPEKNPSEDSTEEVKADVVKAPTAPKAPASASKSKPDKTSGKKKVPPARRKS